MDLEPMKMQAPCVKFSNLMLIKALSDSRSLLQANADKCEIMNHAQISQNMHEIA